jgi:uncharacterized protein (TIGR01777 family)
LRILLSGSHGLIGSHLLSFLKTAQHEVIRLARTQEKGSIYWDPTRDHFQKEGFEGFDAVVHLAGENIGEGRWTQTKKERLFVSRCRDTWLLSQLLSRLEHPPKTVISASAIGFYGDRKDEILTEKSQKGEGFLSDLSEKWEQATCPIENRGVRVIHPRFGAVLSPSGGMLRKLIPPFKMGLGGRIGSGKQIISWIDIQDVVGALNHILMTDSLSGPVNVVAPNPVSQIEFAQVLANRLHRPALLPLPAWLVKVIFGQMGKELLLASTHVKPEKLLQTGYCFRCSHLSDAIRDI